jgi:ABC-type multidrug transport system permease subunit
MPPETPDVPDKASRLWRFVGIVLAFQVLAIVAAVMLFSSLSLANGGGSCGGG